MEDSKEMPGVDNQEISDKAANQALSGLSPEKAADPDNIQMFKNRIKEMNKNAEIMTEALGLPKEAKYEVLRAMYDAAKPSGPGQPGTNQGK